MYDIIIYDNTTDTDVMRPNMLLYDQYIEKHIIALFFHDDKYDFHVRNKLFDDIYRLLYRFNLDH